MNTHPSGLATYAQASRSSPLFIDMCTGSYARARHGGLSPMAAWWSTINNIIVSGDAILSAENSGKPLGGRGPSRSPLGKLTALHSGCVVECRICNREVAGSNLGLGYFAPRSIQPSIPTGSVNEYQLRLGRQRLIPIADERVGVQVKLWNPLRTRAIYLSASAVVIHYEEALYPVA